MSIGKISKSSIDVIPKVLNDESIEVTKHEK